MTKGGRAGGLHGGGESEHWYRYRDGVMCNGLTVVTFFLTLPTRAIGVLPVHPAAIRAI